MSSTRQLTTSGSLLCKSSGAEPNAITSNPTDRKRLVSALRMDTSSSTTNTIGSVLASLPPGAGGGLGGSVTTHPLDAMAARIETSRHVLHGGKPTAVPRGPQ